MATPLTPELEALLLSSLGAVQQTRLLAVASFALLLWDHVVSLDREIEYFWSGKWSMTRILYFANRYFPILILSLGFVCLFTPNLSFEL
ncbi:hypothetical protein EIP91_003674 [Steccherinum ochraceum]|uniref:DUF6533 domain-containing protein n=1 Tax=Steccherinum ochraceum TaxID=92696 RepID=A0A4R0RBI8_9APHY|nr:hypothetical protein EIP91_003674 [Steccherinum ochraceum]